MERFTGMKCCLRALRNRWIFLELTVLAFFLASPPTFGARKLINKGVLTVNDEIILDSDVDKFQHKLQSKSFQELFGGVDPKALQSRDAVLNLLIEEKIINQQVKKLELQASDQEVDGQIRAIVKRNGISEGQLTERLKQLNTTMADYRDGIRRQIERRNLIEREIKPSLEISDEQLRHYYLRTAKPGDSDKEFKIAHILIENKVKGGLSGADRAKRVYAEVSSHPENYEVLAKDYSDDTSTSSTGGVLGYFSASSLSKEFREMVPKTPVGKFTKPIKTAAGYHIVKVLEVRADDFATLPKEKKEALRNQLVAEELEKRMALWIERKKNEAYIKKASDKDNTSKTQNL
jgi:parvulin-like peptidyl-prolyl isomerase